MMERGRSVVLQYIGGKVAQVIVALLNVSAPLWTDVQRDIPYGPGEPHRADVYRADGDGSHQVVVFLYGGGWRTGSKERATFIGASLARRGFVVVIPEYRHVPAAGLPDILADNAAAVAWTISHAREFGGDPRCVIVAGSSSGAWAAAMLAFDARWLDRAGASPDALAGLIGIAGPYAVSSLTERQDRQVFAGRGPEMEPISAVSARRHPPVLLLVGAADTDVLPSSTAALTDRIVQSGGRVDARVYPDAGHDQMNRAFGFPFSLWLPITEDIARFIAGTTGCRSDR